MNQIKIIRNPWQPLLKVERSPKGPPGPIGATGPTGPVLSEFGDLDGGAPNSNYLTTQVIDGGGV
jgi:hypothetical protein